MMHRRPRRGRTPPGASPYRLVVVAASAAGIEALSELLSALPTGFPAAVAISQRLPAVPPSLLSEILTRRTRLKVRTAEALDTIRPGTVYVGPPDLHVALRDGVCNLAGGTRLRDVLSSPNPLFASAAEEFGGRLIAVVLAGGDHDATDGVQCVRACGGIVIAQDEATSACLGRPQSAIEASRVDLLLSLPEIAPALVDLVTGRKDLRALELEHASPERKASR